MFMLIVDVYTSTSLTEYPVPLTSKLDEFGTSSITACSKLKLVLSISKI